jgi:DNA-binding MarR family transcriptional regulator/GNAT superfamily N-acetyltransferase
MRPERTIRSFNRFVSTATGALSRSYLGTPFSLQEARVLYEVGHGSGLSASTMRKSLDMEQAFLSRLLARLERRGLVTRQRSKEDGRAAEISLTERGRQAFKDLDIRADRDAKARLDSVPVQERDRLLAAMQTIQRLWNGQGEHTPRLTIRGRRTGDIGWMLYRQAVVYTQEHGYKDVFETYVSKGLPPFKENFDAKLDRLWVAELDGETVGFVAIHHDPARPNWAKLRWFLVEKHARGRGIGSTLLARALAFAKKAGYDGIELWTVNDLHDARRLYEAAGFRLAKEEAGCEWAPWGKEQKWELRLEGKKGGRERRRTRG